MIRLLDETDAEAFVAIRRAALLEAPFAFLSSPEDDFAGSVEAVGERLRRAPDSVVVGAFEPDLVGVAGLFREPKVKTAHRAHVWGMYVAPTHRGQGLGDALLRAALAHARSVLGVEWVQLGVSAAAPDARRLYERFGFRVWGTEPDALRHGGRSVDVHHLVLRLGGPAQPL